MSIALIRSVPNGACIYVASECYEQVVNKFLRHVPGTFSLVVHDGDQSTPGMLCYVQSCVLTCIFCHVILCNFHSDGQTDYKSGWLHQFQTLPQLTKLHAQGKLIAMHTQNLWWRDWKSNPRPHWLHCLPIGLQTRKYSMGSNLTVYLEAIREAISPPTVLGNTIPNTARARQSKRPLLLVAITPRAYAPDRGQALLSFFGKKPKFYTKGVYDHSGWLRAIREHRFTLCPFGTCYASFIYTNYDVCVS